MIAAIIFVYNLIPKLKKNSKGKISSGMDVLRILTTCG